MCSQAILSNSVDHQKACGQLRWTQENSQQQQRRTFVAQRVPPQSVSGQSLNWAMGAHVGLVSEGDQGSLSEVSHGLRGGIVQHKQPVRHAQPSSTRETILACNSDARYKTASELMRNAADPYSSDQRT
jgi:hypothetical protein